MEQDRQSQKAVALSYQPEEKAPKVIATGQGYVAETIIERAKEEGIPIHKDEKIVNSLSSLDIGEFIPPELYGVVAEIMVFVDSMERVQEKMNKMKK